jgi:hypothetical protein
LFYLHPSFGYYFEYFYLEPLNPFVRNEALPGEFVDRADLDERPTFQQRAVLETVHRIRVACAQAVRPIVDLPKARQKSVRRNPSTLRSRQARIPAR